VLQNHAFCDDSQHYPMIIQTDIRRFQVHILGRIVLLNCCWPNSKMPGYRCTFLWSHTPVTTFGWQPHDCFNTCLWESVISYCSIRSVTHTLYTSTYFCMHSTFLHRNSTEYQWLPSPFCTSGQLYSASPGLVPPHLHPLCWFLPYFWSSHSR